MFRSIIFPKIIPLPTIGKTLQSFSDHRKTLHATYNAHNRTAKTVTHDDGGDVTSP